MTAQIGDTLYVDGEEVALCGEIMLPEAHPRLRRATEEESWDAPGIVHSTANWRGYVATWRLDDGVLWLVGLEGDWLLEPGPPIRATWVDDTLRIGHGEVVDYVHAGFMSRWAEEEYLTVEGGVVTGRRVEHHAPPPPPELPPLDDDDHPDALTP